MVITCTAWASPAAAAAYSPIPPYAICWAALPIRGAAEEKVAAATARNQEAAENIRRVDVLCEETAAQFTQLQSWGALYATAELPVKKMIASALIARVTVSSDYTLDIKFNVSYAQFMGETPEKEFANFG